MGDGGGGGGAVSWFLCILHLPFVSFTHEVFFTVAVWSLLACVKHINFKTFSFDYIMLFQTHYLNLVHNPS